MEIQRWMAVDSPKDCLMMFDVMPVGAGQTFNRLESEFVL